MIVFLLWASPLGGLLRWPVGALHEGGHVLATLASGGQVLDVQLRPDGGETHTTGGWPLLILLAGYPAPSLVAAGLLRAGLRWPGWVLGVAALCDVVEDIGRGDAAMLPGPPVLWSVAWATAALVLLGTAPCRRPPAPETSAPSRR